MWTPQGSLHTSPEVYLPWPSELPTRDLPYGPRPLISYAVDAVHSPLSTNTQASGLVYDPPQSAVAEQTHEAQSLKPNEMRDQPKLLPRLVGDAKPIVVTSSDSDKTIAEFLKQSKIKRETKVLSQQARLLEEALGAETAIWQLASISGSAQPNQSPGSCAVIHIQARVLCIDFIQSRGICFRLTNDTIEALMDHLRAVHCDHAKVYSFGNAAGEERIEALVNAFEEAIKGFVFWTETACLEEMGEDGSGELTSRHSTEVKSAILKLLEPVEQHMPVFQR
jgi:hypothetical protein